MAKLDLASSEWCQLIFEGKNQAYGAYRMRANSPRRHTIAMLIVVAIAIVGFTIPTLLKLATPEQKEVMTEVTTLSKLAEPEKVFDMVEQMPTFPGGQQELMSYLGKNIKYPTIAQENGTQGRVIIQFVVERDGTITDVRVARGVDPYLDKEAVRVVQSMPKWIPGKQNGKAVRVKFTVPVMFRLQ